MPFNFTFIPISSSALSVYLSADDGIFNSSGLEMSVFKISNETPLFG